MTKQQALNTIENIIESQGYRETQGDQWLGPRLSQIQEFIESLPDPPFILRGITELGKEMFYTGKAGNYWVTTERDKAFTYETASAAQSKALMFNRTSELHGLRFMAVQA